MESIVFRRLLAGEIDCRIGQTSRNGNSVSILLYKNARVDMAILDETVGAFGWQRDHKELKGNLYSGVGILHGDKWVWKWDCGTESNTEREKGEASDSFKRACVNWGIGRELYTSPKIWITLREDELNSGKPKVSLSVKEIDYNENGEITTLVIIDDDLNLRFSYHDGVEDRIGGPVNTINVSDAAVNARRANAGRPTTRRQPVKAQPQPTPGYQPTDDATYKAVVRKFVKNEPSASGSDYRTVWIEMTGAGEMEIAKFDADCVIARRQLGIAQ